MKRTTYTDYMNFFLYRGGIPATSLDLWYTRYRTIAKLDQSFLKAFIIEVYKCKRIFFLNQVLLPCKAMQ